MIFFKRGRFFSGGGAEIFYQGKTRSKESKQFSAPAKKILPLGHNTKNYLIITKERLILASAPNESFFFRGTNIQFIISSEAY